MESIDGDIFGYSTRGAAKLADGILTRKTPFAISITADWGGGKTSMLNLTLFCLEYYLENQNEKEDCVNLCCSLWDRIQKKKDFPDIDKMERVLRNIRSGNTKIPIVRFNAWKYHDAPHIAMLTVFAEGIGEWAEKAKVENLKEYVKRELELDESDFIEILKNNKELFKYIFKEIIRKTPEETRTKLEKRYEDTSENIFEEIGEAAKFENIFQKMSKPDSKCLRDLMDSELKNYLAEFVSMKIWEIGRDEIDNRTKEEIIEKILKKGESDKITEKLNNSLTKERVKFGFRRLKRKVKETLESKDKLLDAVHSLGLTHDKIIKGLSVASTLAFGIPIPEGVQKTAGKMLEKGDEYRKRIKKDEIIETLDALSEFDKKLTREGVLSIMKTERIAKELIDRAEKIYERKNFRVVLVVDDLDRALAEHVFKVFETMKTYLDIEGLAIVAAYSPEYVEKALHKVMEQKETIDPKKYLEKLFQINHRIERKEVTLVQFIRFVKNLFLGEVDQSKMEVVEYLARRFLRIVNSLKISPRNFKRILMKAEEICGQLPAEYQENVDYAFAAILYALLELCAPDYFEVLKEKVAATSEQQGRGRKSELRWTIETIMSLVSAHEIKEEEMEVVKSLSALEDMLLRIKEQFSIALINILKTARTGEPLKPKKKLKSAKRSILEEIERNFVMSLGDLFVFCLEKEIPLKIKNVLEGEDFLFDTYEFEKFEKPKKDYKMIIFSKKQPKKVSHLLCIDFNSAKLWGLLDNAISTCTNDRCDLIKVVGIVFGTLDTKTKIKICGDINQEISKLSEEWQQRIRFCITDLPTLFGNLINTYEKTKTHKKELASHVASMVTYMEAK